jgi:bifunctional UDP-N-acetylglucosamine pyrophosphorylase / glucosamine-1-phosphate N-acetyltransferase
MQTSFGIAIMAAGKGTRLKSRRPKVLHEIGGQPLLLHVIAAAQTIAPAAQIYCIIGHEADRVRAAVAQTGVHFILQPDPKGTGHALQQLKQHFLDYSETPPPHLLVLSGDVPLIRPETLAALCAFHLAEHAAMTILTAIPPDPTGYGRILRASPASPEVLSITEQKDLTPSQLTTPEINSGIYCFETVALFANLAHLSNHNANAEFYLTDIAALLVSEGRRVVATLAPHIDEVLGANTIAEMMHLDAALRLATAHRLMAQGVTIFRPETSVIDATVTIAPDTVIEPYVQLLGHTHIGPGCRIRSFSVIQDCTLGDNVLVRNSSVLDASTIAAGAFIGPFAHIRPGTQIGEGAHIGSFVETKNSHIGRGSKSNHLAYLGDAVIGDNVNLGAGVITANYDGLHKHTTTIGDNVFVGSDSTLIAPIAIGSGALIAAGSTLTDDVPPGSLAIARTRQVTKPGWVTARKAKSATDAK